MIPAGSSAILAPVHLPQGAEIKNVSIRFIDNNPNFGSDINFFLYRGTVEGTGVQEILSTSSINFFSSPQTQQVVTAPKVGKSRIDNKNFFYHLSVNSPKWPGNSSLVYVSAVIEWTFPAP